MLGKLFISTNLWLAQSFIASDSVNNDVVIDEILVEDNFAKKIDGWSGEMNNYFSKVIVGDLTLTDSEKQNKFLVHENNKFILQHLV